MIIRKDAVTLIAGDGDKLLTAEFGTDDGGRVKRLRSLSLGDAPLELCYIDAEDIARLALMIVEADRQESRHGFNSDTRSCCVEHGFYFGYSCPICNPPEDVHPALDETGYDTKEPF